MVKIRRLDIVAARLAVHMIRWKIGGVLEYVNSTVVLVIETALKGLFVQPPEVMQGYSARLPPIAS